MYSLGWRVEAMRICVCAPPSPRPSPLFSPPLPSSHPIPNQHPSTTAKPPIFRHSLSLLHFLLLPPPLLWQTGHILHTLRCVGCWLLCFRHFQHCTASQPFFLPFSPSLANLKSEQLFILRLLMQKPKNLIIPLSTHSWRDPTRVLEMLFPAVLNNGSQPFPHSPNDKAIESPMSC
jgi:hypothetical protein